MTADLIAEARAVIEDSTCRERWYAGDRWCRAHDGWFPEGQFTCDNVHASDLYDTATQLLAALEAVAAALSVQAQAEALDRVLAQPMSLDALRAKLKEKK